MTMNFLRQCLTRRLIASALMTILILEKPASVSAATPDAEMTSGEKSGSGGENARPIVQAAKLPESNDSGEAVRLRALNAMTALIEVLKERKQKELIEELDAAELAVSAAKAETEYRTTYFKLRDTSPEEANRQNLLIRTHERNLIDSARHLSVAIICLTAESEKARTRPEDVEKARQELDSLRKQFPQGDGELLKLGRVMLGKQIQGEDFREKNERTRTELLNKHISAMERLTGLPVDLENLCYAKYEKLDFDLNNLKSEVKSARVDDLRGTRLPGKAGYAKKRSEFDAIIKSKSVAKLDRLGDSWTLEIR